MSKKKHRRTVHECNCIECRMIRKGLEEWEKKYGRKKKFHYIG